MTAPVGRARIQDRLRDIQAITEAALSRLDDHDLLAELLERTRDILHADTAAVLTEMVLDLPLAPIVRPLAEAAGKNPDAVDPALTLRRSTPGADALPGQVARVLPRAMNAAGAASEGMAAMTPALRDLAERMRAVLRGVPLDD